MEELEEKIGLLKDRLENINAALQMPIGDKFHVQALRTLIPELIEDVTTIINELTNINNSDSGGI